MLSSFVVVDASGQQRRRALLAREHVVQGEPRRVAVLEVGELLEEHHVERRAVRVDEREPRGLGARRARCAASAMSGVMPEPAAMPTTCAPSRSASVDGERALRAHHVERVAGLQLAVRPRREAPAEVALDRDRDAAARRAAGRSSSCDAARGRRSSLRSATYWPAQVVVARRRAASGTAKVTSTASAVSGRTSATSSVWKRARWRRTVRRRRSRGTRRRSASRPRRRPRFAPPSEHLEVVERLEAVAALVERLARRRAEAGELAGVRASRSAGTSRRAAAASGRRPRGRACRWAAAMPYSAQLRACRRRSSSRSSTRATSTRSTRTSS